MPEKSVIQAGCWNTIGVWGKAQDRCARLETLSHCRNCDVFIDSGRAMFERKPPAGYVHQWAGLLRKNASLVKPLEASIFVFLFGSGQYAIPVRYFVEVTEAKKITRIPHVKSAYVSGVVNISGEICLCHSFNGILPGDGGTDSTASSSRIMVLEIAGERYVFPVAKVVGHVRYPQDEVQPLPSTMVEDREELFVGSIRHNNCPVAIIDAEELHDLYRLNYI